MKNKPYPLYDVMEIKNLKELVNKCADTFGEKTAFMFEREKEEVCISYSQFKSDVDALGTAFYDMGIQNAKIAVIGENSYEWILSYFATVNSGNVIVPLDKELPASDIKNIIDDAGVIALVFSDNYSDISRYLCENNIKIQHYININSIPKLLESGEALCRNGSKYIIEFEVNNNILATLSYTSGTTGNAKGVMLSHKNLASDIVASCRNVFFPKHSILVLPLHHASGFTGLLCMLVYGSKIAINLSLKNLSNDFNKYRPQITVLVPLFLETFYKKIWDGAKKQRKEKLLKNLINISNALLMLRIDVRRVLFKSVLSHFGGELLYVISGGAPLDKKLVDGYYSFGITILNVYGLTETAGVISTNRNDYFRSGSVGQLIPCCEVQFVGKDDNGFGEICVKGDQVLLGYYEDKQATAYTFDDKWFKTGDIGYIDEDGFLYVTGRKKNLIILSNGKNVYPEELEFSIQKHIPYIKEVVVYAGNDEIIAEVFLDTENFPDCAVQLDKDILSFNETQAAYKNINNTVIRDIEFPKTSSKKIKRQYN